MIKAVAEMDAAKVKEMRLRPEVVEQQKKLFGQEDHAGEMRVSLLELAGL